MLRSTRAQFLMLVLASAMAAPLLRWPVATAAPRLDPEPQMKRMVEAIKAKSYDDFVADCSDKFKAALTKQMFDGVAAQVAPRLKQGYRTTFLGRVRKKEGEAHLYKVEPADGKDELLVVMSLKDDKVVGFWVQ